MARRHPELPVAAKTSGFRGQRATLSCATRRATRRAAKLANELDAHSFRIHVDGSVTWVLKHGKHVLAKK